MKPDGFVLAGGESSRMGVDKARLWTPSGWPMATRVGERLLTVCDRVSVVRKDNLDILGPRGAWPKVFELGSTRHPLLGVATALAHAQAPTALVVATDLAFLDEAALRSLVAAGAPAALWSEGRHVLAVLLPKAWGPRLRKAALAGEPLWPALGDITRVEVAPEVARNVNRWEDAGWPHPLARLGRTVSHLPEDARQAALQGELARLEARGVLLPPGLSYAAFPTQEGEWPTTKST